MGVLQVAFSSTKLVKSPSAPYASDRTQNDIIRCRSFSAGAIQCAEVTFTHERRLSCSPRALSDEQKQRPMIELILLSSSRLFVLSSSCAHHAEQGGEAQLCVGRS